jgi:hypothetical protein
MTNRDLKHMVLEEMILLDMANVGLGLGSTMRLNLAKIDYRDVHSCCSPYSMDRMIGHLIDDNFVALLMTRKSSERVVKLASERCTDYNETNRADMQDLQSY